MRRPLFWYAIANTGAYALVPPVVGGVLVPGGLLLVRAAGPAQSMVYAEYCAVYVVPLMAAWWPLFAFRERIEGDGRELLYLLKRGGESVTALLLVLVYAVILLPFVAIATTVAALPAASIVLMFVRVLFTASLSFWSSFALRSSSLALVLVFAFNIAVGSTMESFLGGAGRTALWASGLLPAATVASYIALATLMLAHGEVTSRRFTG